MYVGAGNPYGSGSTVFQSLNGGQTWTLFPDTTYGAVTEGGYLPHVAVTSLNLSLGDIDPDTGMPTLDGPYAPNAANQTSAANADPDTLMAATYGQGEFAINLAPLILGNTVTVSGTTLPVAPSELPTVTGPINILGSSEISGFGNATWITVEDVTNPADPVVVAGFNPADPIPTPGPTNSTNGLGNFSIAFNPETYYTSNGVKTIEVFATDNAGSVGNVVTYSFNLNPPTQLVFSNSGEPPATALAGQNFAAPSPVVVDVEDAADTIATQFNGPVTIALANNATGIDPSSTLTVNAVNGVATFTDLAIDPAGTYVLQATSTGLTPGLSTSITINPAAAAKLVWTTEPPSETTESVPFGATVDLEDQYGNVETAYNQDISVSLDLNGAADHGALSGTTTVAASGGVATFTNLAINALGNPFTLIASSDGLTSSSSAIDVVAPVLVPSDQVQSTQAATAGVGFSLSWTAETNLGTVDTAFDGTVILAILTGPTGATIQGTTSATAVNGIATFTNVILDTAGSYVLQASSGNLVPGDTSVTVSPAAATGLYFEEEPPSNVPAGSDFTVAVGAEDQFGNPTTTLTGTVTIGIENNPGGSKQLGGVLTVTAIKGLATFSGLTLNKAGIGYTLQATNGGTFTSATTSGFNVTANPATQLVFATEPPATVIAGQDFAASPNPVVVNAEDQYGNTDPTYNGPVTIALANNATGIDPSSTLTVNAVNGVATFSKLAIDTVGTYQLEATTNNGLTLATSTKVTVNPDPQSPMLVWSTQPPTQVAHGAPFGVTVDLEDQYHNLETAINGNVTIALDNNPGNAALGGTLTVTASGGVAAFTGLSISKIGNDYTLAATGDDLSTPASNQIDVTLIPAVAFDVTTQPPSSVEYAHTFDLKVTALDQYGNPDPDFTGSVTVAISALREAPPWEERRRSTPSPASRASRACIWTRSGPLRWSCRAPV